MKKESGFNKNSKLNNPLSVLEILKMFVSFTNEWD